MDESTEPPNVKVIAGAPLEQQIMQSIANSIVLNMFFEGRDKETAMAILTDMVETARSANISNMMQQAEAMADDPEFSEKFDAREGVNSAVVNFNRAFDNVLEIYKDMIDSRSADDEEY